MYLIQLSHKVLLWCYYILCCYTKRILSNISRMVGLLPPSMISSEFPPIIWRFYARAWRWRVADMDWLCLGTLIHLNRDQRCPMAKHFSFCVQSVAWLLPKWPQLPVGPGRSAVAAPATCSHPGRSWCRPVCNTGRPCAPERRRRFCPRHEWIWM